MALSVNEIKALEHRWFEAMNKGKAATMAIIDETCTPDFVYHTSSGQDIPNREGFKKRTAEIYDAFPDIHFALLDLIVEGHLIGSRYTMSGTFKGPFQGMPPTNKKMTVWGINIDRMAGGKFVETWERTDTLGMMQQLGLIPTPGKG
jgi:predicted ester cyclase